MEKIKTVILYGQVGLSVLGMEAYLKNQKGWEVIRINKNISNEQFLRIVVEKNPSAVIVYMDYSENANDLPGLLLSVKPDLRIITLNSENNIVEIFGMQKVKIIEAVDLLSLIDCP